jgi:hypothetical protein
MNHRLKEVEESLKEVKKSTEKNTEAIANIEKRVEEIAEAAKTSNECMTKDEIEARLREERDEVRERKDRELNVIVHGAEECGPEISGGEERMAWDKGECVKLFGRHNVRLRSEDIKFCRRVGPKGEHARPLVVGFYSYATRNAVLRVDWKTAAPDMAVGPDLTKKQRDEEAQVWKDMEQKNAMRTSEERAKNLVWRIVGPKGERRLILSTERGREAGTGARGRGAPTTTRGRPRGGRARTTRWAASDETRPDTQAGQPQLLDATRDDQPFRPRIGSKRQRETGRDEEEEMEEEDDGTREPPTKH